MKRYKLLASITLATMLSTSVQGFAATAPNSNDTTQSTNIAMTEAAVTIVSGSYEYTLNTNGEATITHYSGSETDITLPLLIDEHPIVAIGNNAFSGNTTLKNLTITQPLTIGNFAFYQCSALETAIMPEVTSIGEFGFNFCGLLRKVSAPKAVTVLNNAFAQCPKLVDIDFSSLVNVDVNSFQISGLRSVTLPSAVTIQNGAFMACSALSEIYIPNVTSIGQSAFTSASFTSINLPNIVSIGNGAFSACRSLTSLTLSKNLINVGGTVFSGANVTSVAIDYGTDPIDTVTMTTWESFVNTLTGVTLSNVGERYVKNNTTIRDLVRGITYSISSEGATVVGYSGTSADLTIPETVNGIPVIAIGREVFRYNSKIENLTILPDLTIGSYAFSNCSALKTVSMPKVTTVGEYAFQFCDKLTTVNMPSATTINEFAFNFDSGLQTVTGSSLTTLNYGAFSGCTSLSSIDLTNITSLGEVALSNTGIAEAIMPNVTTIGPTALGFCPNLSKVSAPKLTTLSISAFQGCTALVTTDFPLITTISDFAFAYCSSLKIINQPLVTSVGLAAFTNCTSLTDVILPNVTTIVRSSFYNCSSIKTLTLPNVTNIGMYSFSRCTSLTKIDLPKITSLDINVFDGCKVLSDLTLSKNLSTVGTAAFSDTAVTSVTIDYGTEPITNVTLNDWNSFVKTLGLIPDDIPGKYVKNNTGTKDLVPKYIYSGVLQPINADGSSIFKAGSTIPVKFQLKDANGNYVSTAIATLSYTKVTGTVSGDINEAVSTSAATTGNLFRYSDNQYIFNFSTKSLTKGTYKLIITLDSVQSYTVQISLK